MASVQTLMPVYLARYKGKEVEVEDYNTEISTNENALQQNLTNMFNTLQEMKEEIAALQSAQGV